MSKKHGRFRNEEENIETTFEPTEPIIEEAVEEVVEETPVEPEYGYVTGCPMLNVRSQPNGDIVSIVKSGSKLMIDRSKSTNEWFSVCTEDGIEGFCMKKYVNASK